MCPININIEPSPARTEVEEDSEVLVTQTDSPAASDGLPDSSELGVNDDSMPELVS